MAGGRDVGASVGAGWAGGIAPRLVAPVAAVSLLLLAVGVGAAWYVHRLQRNTSDLIAVDIRSVRAAEEMVIAVQEVRNQINQFLDDRDPAHLAAAGALRERTLAWLGEIHRLTVTPREAALAEQLDRALPRLWDAFEDVARLDDPDERERRLRRLVEGVLVREVYEPARKYLDYNEEVVERTTRENLALPGRVALGLLLLGVSGSVAGLVAGFGIARAVHRSIVQLSVPIRDAAGRLGEVVGPLTVASVRDVGDLDGALRTLAEEVGRVVDRLEESRREALRAEQLAALGQLAAGLAHELRNPLTAMKMLVQSAAERGDAEGLRGRRLAILEEEIVRLERTIQVFLDYARPPAPERRWLDLGELAERTCALLAPQAESRGVRLASGPPAGPVPVEADPGQLRQVALNLVINALDASPEGGTVAVSAEASGGEAILRVADAGVGLPPALGDRIFEPFVSTKETGLGLGLPICRRIVAAHGGRIEAADRPGGGAEFVVRLPAGAGPPTEEHARCPAS